MEIRIFHQCKKKKKKKRKKERKQTLTGIFLTSSHFAVGSTAKDRLFKDPHILGIHLMVEVKRLRQDEEVLRFKTRWIVDLLKPVSVIHFYTWFRQSRILRQNNIPSEQNSETE